MSSSTTKPWTTHTVYAQPYSWPAVSTTSTSTSTQPWAPLVPNQQWIYSSPTYGSVTATSVSPNQDRVFGRATALADGFIAVYGVLPTNEDYLFMTQVAIVDTKGKASYCSVSDGDGQITMRDGRQYTVDPKSDDLGALLSMIFSDGGI